MKAFRVVRGQHIGKRHFAMCRAGGAGQGLVEEETLSHYNPSQYYPVHIDQTFCSRYKIAAKVGFGGSSTVWLCEDVVYVSKRHSADRQLTTRSDKSFKTIKIGIRGTSESQEVKVLEYLKSINSPHEGRYCVRRACDSFEIQVPGGRHHCIVYEPLGLSLLDYVGRQQNRTLNAGLVKWTMTYLLKAVDYLHTSGVVHTGIHGDQGPVIVCLY